MSTNSQKAIDAVYSIREQIKMGKNIKNKIPNLMIQDVLKRASQTKHYYILQIAHNKSKFSFLKSLEESGNEVQTTTFRLPYYKDHKTGKLIIRSTTNAQQGVFEPLASINNWNLINQDTIINGIRCLKAISKKFQTEVWYSPDLSYGDGPWHYGGLPGLIVTLRNPREYILLEGLDYPESIQEIQLPEINEIISFDKYMEYHNLAPKR